MFRSFLIQSLVASSLLVSGVFAASSEDWKTRSIYFVLTDRFARDDDSNAPCGDLLDYCGGTWKGMTKQLDYIKKLGFDSIWITPFVKNSPKGYHGYWAQDINDVNEHHGTRDDLKDLVAAAHAKGMYIMADVVVNHMGQGPYESFKPFGNEKFYHDYCLIDYNNQDSIENCRIDKELPDVRTQDDQIRQVFNKWIKESVNEFKFDGLRIDTVKHVEKDFFPNFVASAGVYAVGEVFEGNVDYVAGYQEVMPGVLNYPLYYTIRNAFVNQHSMKAIVGDIDRIASKFKNPSLLANFIDNHDNPRFLAQKKDTSLLKNALALNMLSRGIPIIYGGTEQEYAGGADPANREDLWRSGYSRNGDMYRFIQKLMQAKRSANGLGGDDHDHLLRDSDSEYAFCREGGKLIALLTNRGKGHNAENICFNANTDHCRVPKGTVYTSAISPAKYTVGDNGQLCVSLYDGQPEVLVAQSRGSQSSFRAGAQ